MSEQADPSGLAEITPAHVFDGGDMDCGSGLVLLIRENMLRVPAGDVLELRSREPTVESDLPPWCRMAGHSYLGTITTASYARHFVRRAADAETAHEAAALAEDKAKARAYEWRLRTRATGRLETRVYCRNLSFDVGQPASFEEKDKHPAALELFLGALAADVSAGFRTLCARAALDLDDLELTVRARLENVLAHLGLDEGDPAIAAVEIAAFASSFAETAALEAAWEEALRRAPLYRTLAKSTAVSTRLSIL